MWSNWAEFGCLFFLPRANLHSDPWTHPEPSDDRRTDRTCLQSDQHHSFTTRGPTGCLLGAHHSSWCIDCLSVFQRPPMTTDYLLPVCFSTVETHAGKGDDQQTSQPIGSLDGEGNLLPGPVYSDRLKSGVLSIRRVQPNTFTLRFLRTQVGNIQSTPVCINPAVAGRSCTRQKPLIVYNAYIQ